MVKRKTLDGIFSFDLSWIFFTVELDKLTCFEIHMAYGMGGKSIYAVLKGITGMTCVIWAVYMGIVCIYIWISYVEVLFILQTARYHVLFNLFVFYSIFYKLVRTSYLGYFMCIHYFANIFFYENIWNIRRRFLMYNFGHSKAVSISLYYNNYFFILYTDVWILTCISKIYKFMFLLLQVRVACFWTSKRRVSTLFFNFIYIYKLYIYIFCLCIRNIVII